MKRYKALLLAMGLCLTSNSVCAATWNIVHPELERDIKAINDYPVALLNMALAETGVKYNIKGSSKVMNQSRALKHLLSNREVNVIWDTTDKTRERQLLPVRIPIYKGLIGWRVFLTHPDAAAQYSNINTLEQLRAFRPVQAEDWLDTKVLRSNGFKVDVSDNYQELFTMTMENEQRFFPRSVVEVAMEQEKRGDNQLVIEPDKGIHYPMAFYFFVNKKDKLLARLIQVGLQKAIANGRFDELFMQYHGESLKKLNMPQRTFIPLSNPSLPKETPTDKPIFWYQPEK